MTFDAVETEGSSFVVAKKDATPPFEVQLQIGMNERVSVSAAAPFLNVVRVLCTAERTHACR
jgi:hypothetical protein